MDSKDLHLEEDVLPIFDYTHNTFARETLRNMLLVKLPGQEDITARQQIIQAIIANRNILSQYGYSSVDLKEVHAFLLSGNISSQTVRYSRFSLSMHLSRTERDKCKAKIIQAILLLDRLYTRYFSQIDISVFPIFYQQQLKAINNFLLSFNLHKYATIIRERSLNIRQLYQLLNHIAENHKSGETSSFWNRFFQFEALLSVSHACIRHSFTFAHLIEGPISLHGFYHPSLRNPVPNSFHAKNNILLLTGPNMSGKSTLLKAIGLCIYLAHIGFPVPAASCSTPYFSKIMICLHHQDDMHAGYSHFLSDVMRLKMLLEELRRGHHCFAVFDELFNGTTSEDALEILETTLKGLSKYKDSYFIFATHLHALKNSETVRLVKIDQYFLECSFTNQIPHFTYQVKQGWSDLKIGKILFEQAGLNHLLT